MVQLEQLVLLVHQEQAVDQVLLERPVQVVYQVLQVVQELLQQEELV